MRRVQHQGIVIPVPDSIPVDDEIESEYLDGYLIGQDPLETPDSIQDFKSNPNVIVYHPCFWQGVDDGFASRISQQLQLAHQQ
jgi:hypothetical protein